MDEQQEPLNPNQILGGRFRIISEGVRRDVGMEFKAYDTRLDRLVVALMVDRRFWGGAEILERLAGIRKAVAELNDPALLPIEHGGVVDGQLYLVRSRAEGLSLSHLLARTGPLETKAALEIAYRLCEALAPAHRAGLVHGSLSPHSVFVADDGRVTVTDPGLFPALRPMGAQPGLPSSHIGGQPWGRFPYISPEQAAGLEVRAASDVYIIGSLIYEMLTGRPPFRARDETLLALQHLRSDPPSLQVLVPYVPVQVAQIVHKALAKEPAARYRNAGQLAYILRSQLDPREASGRPQAPAPHVASAERPMVVPPPPPLPADVPRFEGQYGRGSEAASEAEDRDGVDWLTIGLIVGALLAMLGLIPLWRTVYRAYAGPPSSPTPTSYRWAGGDMACLLLQPATPEGQATDPGPVSQVVLDAESGGAPTLTLRNPARETAGLDEFGLLRYNQMFPGSGVEITVLQPYSFRMLRRRFWR
jgi:hypothetical protein